jgi:LysR family transcriptional regulator, cyn operon transcriptional activator
MIKEMGGDYLQWLRGFYHVAKTGSFSLAGAEIGRNQPTISHQIKCLEEKYGVILFIRSKEKMELTWEGKILFEKAISIFEIVKSVEGEIHKTNTDLKGRIKIASTHAVIQSFLTKYIVGFSKKHPNVLFDVHGGGLKTILERVESADADFGFLNLRSVPKGLNYYNLFETTLVLVAPKESSFNKNKRPTLKQISKHPFIFFPRSSTIHSYIAKKFKEKDLKLNVIMVLNNFDIVKKYVQLGMGVTILDEFTLTERDYDHLKVIPLDHYFDSRHYGMVTRKTKYLSPTVRSFIHSIKPDIEA